MGGDEKRLPYAGPSLDKNSVKRLVEDTTSGIFALDRVLRRILQKQYHFISLPWLEQL